MPRKRNPQTIASVLDASWHLFGEKGYNATSYDDISRKSGVNRATVQHYFPKKEMMAQMNLEKLRTACADVVDENWPGENNRVALQYLVGQVYVAALINIDEARQAACDVLENRAFTAMAIPSDLDWSVEQTLGADSGKASEGLLQDVIADMEGLYGLIYFGMKTGLEFDLQKRLRPGLTALGVFAGYDAESCNAAFDRCVIEHDDLVRLSAEAYTRAFGAC